MVICDVKDALVMMNKEGIKAVSKAEDVENQTQVIGEMTITASTQAENNERRKTGDLEIIETLTLQRVNLSEFYHPN